ncbi:cobalamin B12-binding domain-containing protein [Metabacillus halosaccharovorans]|uniref:cobalamin B12-binding domain-containing protein n=1 Tax=Metabacillus halosaccharovorans TaxID=930124 RepID=UPI0037352D63
MNDLSRKLAQLLLLGDTMNSYKLVEDLLFEGFTTLNIYENVIRDAMYYIGYLCKIDEISVADEHLATGTADYVLTKLQFRLEQEKQQSERKKLAIVFCVEGEEHFLGAKMAASLFKEHGWDVRYLGPNLPLQHAIFYANKSKPDMICISVTVSHNLKLLPEYLHALESLDQNFTILIGSRLSEKYNLEKFLTNRTKIVRDLSEMTSIITNEVAHSLR